MGYSTINAATDYERKLQENAKHNSKCTQCLHQHPFNFCNDQVSEFDGMPIICGCKEDATIRVKAVA
jgi:hypothetical protein